jgi:hypothetical protein
MRPFYGAQPTSYRASAARGVFDQNEVMGLTFVFMLSFNKQPFIGELLFGSWDDTLFTLSEGVGKKLTAR